MDPLRLYRCFIAMVRVLATLGHASEFRTGATVPSSSLHCNSQRLQVPCRPEQLVSRNGMLSASSDEHFREWIGQNPSSVALFSAPWCKACKRAKPEVAQTLQQQSVPAIEVDADTMEDITEEHKVTKLPTVLVFKDGAPVGRASGPNAGDLLAIVVSCGLLDKIEKSVADSDAPPAKRARIDGKEQS